MLYVGKVSYQKTIKQKPLLTKYNLLIMSKLAELLNYERSYLQTVAKLIKKIKSYLSPGQGTIFARVFNLYIHSKYQQCY